MREYLNILKDYFEVVKDLYKRYEKKILLGLAGGLFVILVIVMLVTHYNQGKPDMNAIKPDVYEDVNTLVDKYFAAKANGDVETLRSIQVPFADTDEMAVSHESELIEQYNNIICYTHDEGVTKNIYVVFAYYEIKFPDVETLVPGLETLVISKDAEGKLYINKDVNSLTDSDRKVLEDTLEKVEVIALFDDVETTFAIALNSDEGVKKFFEALGGDVDEYTVADDTQEDAVTNEDGSLTLGGLDAGKVPGPVNKEQATVINLDMYESPDEASTIIANIPVGTLVNVIEYQDNGYAKITYNETEGYVETGYIYNYIVVNDKVTGTCNYYASCSNVIQPLGTLSEGVEYERVRYFGNGCSEIKINDTFVYVRHGELDE